MYYYYSNPSITICTFSCNTAATYGGGVSNDHCSLTVSHCVFSGNSAGRGGGMRNASSSTTITGCEFSGNSAITYGGGIDGVGSYVAVSGCTFTGNSATRDGGGMMHNGSGKPRIENCIFSHNLSAEAGG